ncbi:MAG: chitobiase/beta-hexosaminidase C-terminal domain-containing protein [Bryobacteraceae bacterium]
MANPSISGSTTIYISPQPFLLLPQLPIIDVGPATSHGIFIQELATDGFPHPVNYSVTGLPVGVAASVSPTTLTGTGQTTVTFSASAAAVQGSYPISVVGQDSVYAPLSQSVPLTLVVTSGFSFSVNPAAAATVPGGSVAVMVTESAPQGSSDTVLVEANTPTGITAAFPQVQQPVQQFTGPGSAPLLFAVDPSLAPGSYSITVGGQDSAFGETSLVQFTLTVNAITGPSVLTMSPNPGTQTTQPLTFTFTDPSGGASITTAGVLVNSSQATAAACYVQYTASTQTLSLSNDAGTGWAGSAAIGTFGELSNSQCLLDTGASQVAVSGSTLTLTLVLTPVAPVVGTQNVYATVSDSSSTSGWVELGFWSISANSLPSPWRDQDIGPVSIVGNTTYNSTPATFTVNGSGTGTTTPPDQFHYTYQPLVGDGTIVAQLATVSNIFQYTEAGIMIRASTNPSDAYVFLNVQPNNGGCNIGVRVTSAAVATYNPCSSSLPLSTSPQYSGPTGWLRITRQGNTFSIQISPDGVNWTSAGAPVAVAMTPNVVAGLAVSSTNAGGITTATFANVSVTPASATAAPTFSPAGGTYSSTQTVAISTATPGALIRYTLDGSTPSETAGTLYGGPITTISTTSINAIAYSIGLNDSSAASATYTISCINNLYGRGTPGNKAKPPRIDMSWSTQAGATGYSVLRSGSSGGPYALIGTTTSTAYSDTSSTLVNGDTYYYVVQPFDGSTEICQSNQAAVTIP